VRTVMASSTICEFGLLSPTTIVQDEFLCSQSVAKNHRFAGSLVPGFLGRNDARTFPIAGYLQSSCVALY
jgi:hypothetical protein